MEDGMSSDVQKFRKTQQVVAKKIGDEYLLLKVEEQVGQADSIYILSNVAAYIWEQLENTASIGDGD